MEQGDSKKPIKYVRPSSSKRKTSVIKDNNDRIFTKSTAVNQRTKYCKHLSIAELNTDGSILKNNKTTTSEPAKLTSSTIRGQKSDKKSKRKKVTWC